MTIEQQIHSELEAVLKGMKTQTEGEYQCSPTAIALYRFLKDNYDIYTRENPCPLSVLAENLNYWDRTGDKSSHDKCREIISDMHEINNSQKWEKVICTNHKNGYWLSHDQKDIDYYIDFYRKKFQKAVEREYAILFKLHRHEQGKLFSNSYDPKPIEEKHEQFHEVKKERWGQGSVFGDGVTIW